MLPLTPTQSSLTTPAIWSWWCIPMHRTSPNQTPGAAPAEMFSCPTILPTPPTTAPSSPLHKSSKQSCPPLPRPSSAPSTLIAVKRFQPVILSLRWATPSPRRPSKPTTRRHFEGSTTPSSRASRKPWTCVSTGCAIASRWFKCRHYWMSGPYNKGNYVTKHHETIHYMATRTTYLTPKTILDAL